MTEAEQRIREAIAWGDAPGARIDPADAAALLADRDEREAALRAEVEALKADLSTYMQAANEHLADAEALRKLQAGEAYKAADYLRAQADAQPVAPVALVRAYNAGYMAGHHDTAEGGFVDIHPSDMDTYHADVVAELGLPAAPQVVASFYTESDELIGTTYAPIKKIRVEDDGTLHVFIDHWPQPVPAGWKLVPVEPTPEMLQAGASIMDFDRSGWYDADVSRAEYRAMLAAAPAAPQAEPMADSDADYWLRNRQPILDAIERAGFMLMSNASGFWLHPRGTTDAQAEPKPTPASGNDLNVYKEMADNYRNDAEPTGAPYGIIDPDYGRVYTIARKLAWEEGYAIGLHGSFTRDLDLIAVPWAERACEPEHLIHRIVDATGLKLRDGVAVKPHGRRAWTLKFPTFGDPRFVDLSVMPRIGGSDDH